MRLFIFFIGVLLIYSCTEPTEEEKSEVSQSEFRISQEHSKVVQLNRVALKKVDNWNEYRSLKNFLEQYSNISPNEAMSNSRELNSLVKVVKDSAKPKFLEIASFKSKVNLLHNETLRLNDMSTISAIKYTEVNDQVAKILEAYSAINAKINTLVQQEKLDKEIDDPKFNKLFTNAPPIDSVLPKKKPFEKVKPKKNETKREKMMRLSKEDRLKKRSQKIQAIQKKNNEKKKLQKKEN